jgi:hypothetical protein
VTIPPPDNQAAFELTTCYAAGRCQGDLICPGMPGRCVRVPDLPGDEDGYDDEW